MSRSILARPTATLALGLLFASFPAHDASAGTPGPTGPVPSAANTGVPDGTPLTIVNGNITVSVAGTVISNKDVRGVIYVMAPNVTIKNSIIRGKPVAPTGSAGLIQATYDGFLVNGQPIDTDGLNIYDVTLQPQVKSVYWNGIFGDGFTLDRVEITNVTDGVHIVDTYKTPGGKAWIFNSWIHDVNHFDYDPSHTDGSHDDSFQIASASDVWLKNNVITVAHNANLQVTQGAGVTDKLLVENNIIKGGSCSINIDQIQPGKTRSNSAPVNPLTIRDNIFQSTGSKCDMIIDDETRNAAVITGNVRENGTTLQIIGSKYR